MAVSRLVVGGTSLIRTSVLSQVRGGTLSPLNLTSKTKLSIRMTAYRSFSNYKITPNLLLNSSTDIPIQPGNSTLPKFSLKTSKPLLVLLEYMNAKPKHIDKFVDFYMGHGFDVLRINLRPWQLLWPVNGSQVVAKDIADFLHTNELFSPVIIHGFSVGCYLWGEVVVQFSKKLEKFQPVADRICAQIYDSGVDVNGIPTGFPAAVFPEKPVLRNTFERYIRYHMKTFYNESTRHYIASRAAFAGGIVRAPTLMMFSDEDPLSTPVINEAIKQELSVIGLPCDMKLFKGSKHVMHYQKHKDEYLAEVEAFLVKSSVLMPRQLRAAKL